MVEIHRRRGLGVNAIVGLVFRVNSTPALTSWPIEPVLKVEVILVWLVRMRLLTSLVLTRRDQLRC